MTVIKIPIVKYPACTSQARQTNRHNQTSHHTFAFMRHVCLYSVLPLRNGNGVSLSAGYSVRLSNVYGFTGHTRTTPSSQSQCTNANTYSALDYTNAPPAERHHDVVVDIVLWWCFFFTCHGAALLDAARARANTSPCQAVTRPQKDLCTDRNARERTHRHFMN